MYPIRVLLLSLVFMTAFQTAAAAPNEARKIRLGVIAPLSGQFAAVGKSIVNGITLSVDDIKARGAPIDLIVEDDSYDATSGVTAFRKLVEVDKVDTLINLSSTTISAIAPQVRSLNLPVLQFGEPTEPSERDSIFQILPDYIPVMQEFAVRIADRHSKVVKIVAGQTAGFNRLNNALLETLKKRRASYQAFSFEPGSAKAIAAKVLTSPTDVLVLCLASDSLGEFLKELSPRLEKDTWLVLPYFQVSLPELRAMNTDFTSISSALAASTSGVGQETFKARYEKKFGEQPHEWAADGYDAVKLIFDTHAESRESWIDNLQKSSYQGVSGNIKFDAVGKRLPEVRFGTIQALLSNP